MSDRVLSIACFLVAAVVVVVHGLVLGSWMLDDAFIFFRYAENWAAGHGPVYNVGEPPVEGFTSFLWLAVLTLVHALGADLYTTAVVLGYALIIGTLWLVSQSWRWLDAIDGRAAAFGTLLLGTCAAFTPWTRGGMETALHALLITSVLLFYVRAKERGVSLRGFAVIGSLCALIGMNRPDGLLVVAVLAVDAASARRSVPWAGFGVTAAVFVVGFGSYYAWRFSYFGYPFPNTFYAKVGASSSQVWRGLAYAGDAAILLAPLLACAVGGAFRSIATRRYAVVPIVLLVHTAYVVVVGGDIMPAHRFFTPFVPALALYAGLAVRRASGPAQWAVVLASCVFGIVLMFANVTPLIRADVVAHNGRISGLWLRENAPKDAVIATNTAGTVVYYSGLKAIDMLGLNDLHIAHLEIEGMGGGHAGHEKGDGDYVLRRRPEFIQLGSSLGWVPSKGNQLPPFLGGKQLWVNPEFHEQYELLYRMGDTLWPGGKQCGLFGFYVRKDILPQLEKRR